MRSMAILILIFIFSILINFGIVWSLCLFFNISFGLIPLLFFNLIFLFLEMTTLFTEN